jgi:hypothetical protein
MHFSRPFLMGGGETARRLTALRFRPRFACNKKSGKRCGRPFIESLTPRPSQTYLRGSASYPRPRAITFRACKMGWTTRRASDRCNTALNLGRSPLRCSSKTSCFSIQRHVRSSQHGNCLVRAALRAVMRRLDNSQSRLASTVWRSWPTSTEQSRPCPQTRGGGPTPDRRCQTEGGTRSRFRGGAL